MNRSFYGYTEAILEWSSIAFFVVMFLCTVIQLVFRNAMIPLSWTEDLAKLTFIWGVFTILPVITYKHRHLTISFLTELFPSSQRRFISLLIDIIICVALFWVTFFSTRLLRVSWDLIDPTLNVTTAIYYIPVWLGVLGSAMSSAVNLIAVLFPKIGYVGKTQ